MWNIFKKAEGGLGGTTPQISFLLGLLGGVAVISTVGFVILLVLYFGGNGFGGGAAALVRNNPSINQGNQPTAPTGPVDVKVSSSDHITGNPKAKVTMIVFSDYQCPFCGRFHPTLKQVIATYGDKIRVVFKHFPLDSIHPNARPAANASECVAALGGNDAFWQYTDKLFEKQTQLSDTLYTQLAKEVGVSESSFNSCYQAKKYASKVDADYQQGLAAGVQGTPAAFVNGTLIPGAVPFEQVKSVIDAALK